MFKVLEEAKSVITQKGLVLMLVGVAAFGMLGLAGCATPETANEGSEATATATSTEGGSETTATEGEETAKTDPIEIETEATVHVDIPEGEEESAE